VQVERKKVRAELSSEAGAAAARLSKRLVDIQTDLDLPPLRRAPGTARVYDTCYVLMHAWPTTAGPVRRHLELGVADKACGFGLHACTPAADPPVMDVITVCCRFGSPTAKPCWAQI